MYDFHREVYVALCAMTPGAALSAMDMIEREHRPHINVSLLIQFALQKYRNL
jgi:hypothetical protein